MTKIQKALTYMGGGELVVLSSLAYSSTMYMNVQMAYLSSLFVILGSSYAYKSMIIKKVDADEYEGERNLLETIEDPHGLYEEELDLKEIVKEERAKIKTLSRDSMKKGVKGAASLFRLVPYAFLVLGFMSLENNGLLDISIYLPSLLLGIIVGSSSAKELF
ncbi:MAG: hypothetical protein Q9M32_06845 [Sulfurimonas sp.]|nr:hypothetical protein [Sulfurimonas sp.]MDQ7061478.1 hypothetical protein [Sulfurimonas sp.]